MPIFPAWDTREQGKFATGERIHKITESDFARKEIWQARTISAIFARLW
jgi:hypothetical protein